MNRLEDIKKHLDAAQGVEEIHDPAVELPRTVRWYLLDTPYLLERIEHLERENERLRHGLERIVHPTAGTWIDPAAIAGDALTSPTTNLSNRLDD